MKKFILIGMALSTLLMADYSYSNSGAKQAFKDLDCEFEDCSPKEQKVKIVEKQVIVEKRVVVEKPVVIVKEVVKEVPVEKIVEKVVYRDRPTVETKEKKITPKKELSTHGITLNKAYFDIYTNTQAPILDYITYTTRGSFDVDFFADSVSKIKERDVNAYVYGKIAVPSSITTDQVYMSVGEKYHYGYYSYWKKDIAYNKGTNQNSDYFLAKVQTDNKGRRCVSYKISIHLSKPYDVNAAEKNVAPNTYFFKMAPKVRGYKSKFIPAQIYIVNE